MGRGRSWRCVAVRAEGGAQENLMAPFEVTKSIISLSVAVMGEVGAQENLMTPFEIEITK